MHGHIVAGGEQVVLRFGAADAAREHPGMRHGNVRIEAERLHAQRIARVGYQRADFTQADHTQRFAHDFRADKFVLAFFHQLGDALFALERLAPGNAAHDVARGQQHARQHQFLHGVGIGTRGVKNHHALLAKGVQGNVVHARARARYALDALRQGELV